MQRSVYILSNPFLDTRVGGAACDGEESSGYELEGHTLSPIDLVALIALGSAKNRQIGRVLDPSWTLERSQDWRTQLALSGGSRGDQESLVAASAVTDLYHMVPSVSAYRPLIVPRFGRVTEFLTFHYSHYFRLADNTSGNARCASRRS